MMSKNSIVPFLKDYLIKFLTRPFLLDTNALVYDANVSELEKESGYHTVIIKLKAVITISIKVSISIT